LQVKSGSDLKTQLQAMLKTAIIIPCYNEEKRIQQELVAQLISATTVNVYLTNDGSTDGTAEVLDAIAQSIPERCFVINYAKNRGKANTIFEAANYLLAKEGYTHIGYFDADFSTPVEEVVRMLNRLNRKPDKFLIGSRIKLLNNDINRKVYRHIIGRIIITIVNIKLKLGIYDTQCGAKLFPVEIAKVAFSQSFRTSWLFDIEIFLRLQQHGLLKLGEEFPLRVWNDVDGSKLSWKTSFKIIKEINILNNLK
jgi:dolichyl-phosphate beta-glucosyltransferase